MTFAIRNLSVLAYAQGFTLWHYKLSASPVAAASRPGFFDDAADMMAPGDMVMVSGVAGGRVLVVGSAKGGVVTAPLG
jgi:hypothetical protein